MHINIHSLSYSLIIGLPELEPIISSIRFLILSRAKFSSFSLHYLSYSGWLLCMFYSSVPYFWSICIFFAIIDLALPSFGSGNINCSPGDVPKILLRMNFLSFMKFPLGPSMSDSKKMNLPLMLLWSSILSIKSCSLSKASSCAPIFVDYSEKNNFWYCKWKK